MLLHRRIQLLPHIADHAQGLVALAQWDLFATGMDGKKCACFPQPNPTIVYRSQPIAKNPRAEYRTGTKSRSRNGQNKNAERVMMSRVEEFHTGTGGGDKRRTRRSVPLCGLDPPAVVIRHQFQTRIVFPPRSFSDISFRHKFQTH
jgi:hypothetical protein